MLVLYLFDIFYVLDRVYENWREVESKPHGWALKWPFFANLANHFFTKDLSGIEDMISSMGNGDQIRSPRSL